MGSAKNQRRFGGCLVTLALLILVLLWTIPTLGIFVSSFRDRLDIQTSGWWTVLPHREWETVNVIDVSEIADLDRQGVMEFEGVSGTFEEFREGIQSGDVRAKTGLDGELGFYSGQLQTSNWWPGV
jgi:alpha-glucoside transport system permease protein